MNQYALEKAQALFNSMDATSKRNMKLYRKLMARAVVRAQYSDENGECEMSEENINDITDALQEMCKQEGKQQCQ